MWVCGAKKKEKCSSNQQGPVTIAKMINFHISPEYLGANIACGLYGVGVLVLVYFLLRMLVLVCRSDVLVVSETLSSSTDQFTALSSRALIVV